MELEVHDHLELFRLLDKDSNGGLSLFELVDGVRRLWGGAKNYEILALLSHQQEIMTMLHDLSAAGMRQPAVKGSMMSL